MLGEELDNDVRQPARPTDHLLRELEALWVEGRALRQEIEAWSYDRVAPSFTIDVEFDPRDTLRCA